MTPDEMLVRIHHVHKVYTRGRQQIDVLRGVSLDIPRGDFLALMGPSGSGKTTLLKLVGGLDQPSQGAIEVDGHRINQMSARSLARWRADHVGFVFQLYNLLPMLTAERNVELPLLLTRLTKSQRRRHVQTALSLVGLTDRARHYPRQLSGGQEQRVGIALTLVGLADRASHKPRELSGGQEQRVAIARAIVSDPTLLICDEPTGDLDRKSGDEILDLLQTLNREHGKTIVMVTHDPRAAERARRTLHLEKGVLVEEGVPA